MNSKEIIETGAVIRERLAGQIAAKAKEGENKFTPQEAKQFEDDLRLFKGIRELVESEPKPDLSHAKVLNTSLAGSRGSFFYRLAKATYENRPLQEVRAITTTSGSGSIDTDVLSDEFIEFLAKENPLRELGARFQSDRDNKKWPKVTGKNTVTWPGTEGTTITDDSGLTISSVQRDLKTMATNVVKVSVEYLDNAGRLGEEIVNDTMRKSISDEIIRVAMQGDSASNEPVGLDNTSGVNFVPAAGALADYSKVINTIKKCMLDDCPLSKIGMLYGPEVAAQFAGLQDVDNNPMTVPRIVADRPQFVTNAVKNTYETNNTRLYLGDWSNLIVGLRGPVELKLIERYMDSLQVGFIAYIRMDLTFLRANQFGVLTGITTQAPTT